MFYVYRCTTQQLEEHLNRIAESGDHVIGTHYIGGRDWILICHKGPTDAEREAARARVNQRPGQLRERARGDRLQQQPAGDPA